MIYPTGRLCIPYLHSFQLFAYIFPVQYIEGTKSNENAVFGVVDMVKKEFSVWKPEKPVQSNYGRFKMLTVPKRYWNNELLHVKLGSAHDFHADPITYSFELISKNDFDGYTKGKRLQTGGRNIMDETYSESQSIEWEDLSDSMEFFNLAKRRNNLHYFEDEFYETRFIQSPKRIPRSLRK